MAELEQELEAARGSLQALAARAETQGAGAETARLEAIIAARTRELAEKTRSLEDANRELQELTSNLDQIVRQRTRALAESEAQLRRRNAQLDRLNRLKSEFISIAAHEFRTPMTAIIGYLDLIAEQRLGEVPDGLRRPLASLTRNAARLQRLIEDLLDISRLDAGRMVLRRRSCDLNEIVASAIAELETFWMGRQHAVEFRPAAGLPRVDCDPDKIHQVVANLLGNAIKYTPPNGHITLSTAQPDPEHVTLRVRDDGIGIPAAARQRIFEPFSEITEARHHTSESPDSAGLGLYIAKGILELHGASILVDSEEGCFTEFRVTLPLEAGPAATGVESEPPGSSGPGQAASGSSAA